MPDRTPSRMDRARAASRDRDRMRKVETPVGDRCPECGSDRIRMLQRKDRRFVTVCTDCSHVIGVDEVMR